MDMVKITDKEIEKLQRRDIVYSKNGKPYTFKHGWSTAGLGGYGVWRTTDGGFTLLNTLYKMDKTKSRIARLEACGMKYDQSNDTYWYAGQWGLSTKQLQTMPDAEFEPVAENFERLRKINPQGIEKGDKVIILDNLESELRRMKFMDPTGLNELVGTEQTAYAVYTLEDQLPDEWFVTVDLCCEIPIACCQKMN